MKKVLLSLLVTVCAFATASAYDFMVDGLAYNINSDGTTVTLTFEQTPSYIGWDEETEMNLYTPAYANIPSIVTIPATVTHDGTTYPVTRIGKQAFHACLSLTGVNIPASVNAIELNPFESCDALVQITVDDGNEIYDSRDGCNAVVTKQAVTVAVPYTTSSGSSYTINQSYLQDQVVVGCKASVIPSTATSIGYRAFASCRMMTSLVIPEGVTLIDKTAFTTCLKLKTLTLPSTLTNIGQTAFTSCLNLEDIYAYFNPENVTIGKNAWQEVNLPEHTVNLHVYADYVQWLNEQPETSNWVWQSHRFNVIGDLALELYLKGSFNTWGDGLAFTRVTGTTWTATQAMEAGAEFKVLDNSNNWYGGSDEDYMITQEAVANGTAIAMSTTGRNFMIPVAGTWTFTVDMSNNTIVVSGEWDEPQPEPTQVYILGEVNENGWAPNVGLGMATEDNVTFTADVNFDGRNDGFNYFSFTTKLAENADDWSGIANYRFGAVSEGDFVVTEEMFGHELDLTYNSGQAFKIQGGDYNLNVNLETMKIVITKKATVLVGDVTGDGVVDVSDVNAVVSIILGNSTQNDYPGNADVNGDGSIDVSDVNTIVGIVLGS